MVRRSVATRTLGRGQKKITVELVRYEGFEGIGYAFLATDATNVRIGVGTPAPYDMPADDEAAILWLERHIERDAIRGNWGDDTQGVAPLIVPRRRLVSCERGVPAILEYELAERIDDPLLAIAWSLPEWVKAQGEPSMSAEGRLQHTIVVDATPGTKGWIALCTSSGAVATEVQVVVGQG